MFNLIYEFIAYSIPIGIIVWFIISLILFISAKRQSKANPDTFPKSSLITPMVMLIVSSVLLGLMVLVVVGFIALLSMALAYM